MGAMDLHRASHKPDWEQTDIGDRNIYQKIAATTGGLATPANVILTIGFILVILGVVTLLQENYILSILLLTVGRTLDIVDGVVAEATGTKSLGGEMFDAIIDRLGALGVVIALFISNLAPWWVIVSLIGTQVVLSIVAICVRCHTFLWAGMTHTSRYKPVRYVRRKLYG